MEQRAALYRLSILMDSLGVDAESFTEFWEWALSEHLVADLSASPQMTTAFFEAPDALARFCDILCHRTGRNWSFEDCTALFLRVREEKQEHFRTAIPYEERMRLLLTKPLECHVCGRKPPEVKLHIDHIVPVSKGGGNQADNLQFLCAQHNLKKSNRMEVSRWLRLS